MKRKALAAAAFTAVLAAALAGCGDQSTTSKDAAKSPAGTAAAAATTEAKASEAPKKEAAKSSAAEQTNLSFVFADGDEGAKKSMNEIVNRFNESHEGIKVTIEPGNGGNYSEFLKTKDSVGEFPDVMEMRDTAMYVRAGKLEPLSDEIVSLFKSPMEFDGKVYTAAFAGENTDGIIYNKKYFDENGLAEPQTYEEFLTLCQTIKDKGDMAPLVVGGQDLWHMGFWFNKAYDDQVMSADPDFIEHCYDGSKNFSDPAVKATFEEMKAIMQYAQDGWVSTPDAQITTFLVNDMAAMMFSGTHMFGQIKQASPDFEMGWFPVPSPDGKLRLVGGSGIGGLAISAEAAKDANKKAAAEEFIKYFFSPDNYKVYCEALSAVPSTVETPDMDVLPVLGEVIEATGKADVLSPMWNGKSDKNELPPDFRNFTYKTLIEILQGSRDIDSACEEMNKTWKVAAESFNPVTGTGIN